MMVKQMAPTNTNRTRLGKRKQEMQELRKEKQTITSKKHDKTCLEKDNSKDNSKSQLMVLQEQFDALKIEYEKQLETVHLLEIKVKDLEKERTNYQPNVVKTDKGDILMLCCECEYPAEDIFDLGEHMYEAHSQNEESELSCELCGDTFSTEESLKEHKMKIHKKEWSCNYCSESFEWKSNLMIHKKENHEEKVSSCWNHTLGTCQFGDTNCWFIHRNEGPKPKINCKICDKDFLIRSEYLIHRKINHPSTVQLCRNEECKYGDNCWFLHQAITR